MTSQLMDVLADEPRVVLCDLTGMAAAGAAVADMFAPAVSYLADWPGTVVVVTAPDAAVRSALESAALRAERLFVQAGSEIGPAEAHDRLPRLRRSTLQLSPQATAPRQARDFVVRTLDDWGMASLSSAACLVVSELVTNSILHAVTVMDLRLSMAEGRVRVAVRDRGGGRPSARPGEATQHTLDGRGLQLVQAFARSWGVIPAPARGKTVWAVLDGADALATSGSPRRSR
ncbi:MAG TPA: ATP-binding protein [Nocardioidaceae bacterium]|nr:ATP-binding protein [Nocardioidaceae bacterium]